MNLPHEIEVLTLVGVSLTVAYLGIFPSLKPLTLGRLVRADMAISGILLGVCAALYFGKELAFSLLFFDLPWWAFLLFSLGAAEVPLFLWFVEKHELDLTDDE